MVNRRLNSDGDGAQQREDVQRVVRVQHRGEKNPFSYAPLRDPNYLSTFEKHFAGSPARKANHSVRDFALEWTFVDLQFTRHQGGESVSPPMSCAKCARRDVEVPTRIVARYPPIDPQVAGL